MAPMQYQSGNQTNDTLECIQSVLNNEQSQDAASYIMIGVTLFLLPILVYMTVRVFRLVWPNEKVVPIMLVMLCITLITLIAYFSFLIYSTNRPEWQCSDSKEQKCVSGIFAFAPAICLANAVILNLNKWIYFKLRINAFVKIGLGFTDEDNKSVNTESEDSASCQERKQNLVADRLSNDSDESAILDNLQSQNERMRRKQKLNNICCTLVASTYNIVTFTFMLYPCFTGKSLAEYNLFTCALMFSILGVVFLIYGVGMNMTLKY